MLGKIKQIKEVCDVSVDAMPSVSGKGGRLGVAQMMGFLGGFGGMDGYMVETENHTYYVLIDNGQSCCENWGYLTSEDDHDYFIGAELLSVSVTDTALNQTVLTKMDKLYVTDNETQFVTFETSIGAFQLAVYNSHNGYYGHGIMVAKDSEILVRDTL